MDYEKTTIVAENSVATQWHPAFFGTLQIEFEEDADNLIFENEHQLSTKPMAIDVLIIKKISDRPLHKNIGHIFRKYNIIEYKSPDDYLSINDFYKVYGYTCFYKYDAATADEIKITDVTITLVSEGYPRDLVKHLQQVRKYDVVKYMDGIYFVTGDIIPIQLIVKKRLSIQENLWLASLTDDLREQEQAKSLLKTYGKHKTNPLYQSVMETIAKKNKSIFEEGNEVCKTLEEIMDKHMERAQLRGEEIGKEIGEQRINNLVAQLIESGRNSEVYTAVTDSFYQQQLLQEFGL